MNETVKKEPQRHTECKQGIQQKRKEKNGKEIRNVSKKDRNKKKKKKTIKYTESKKRIQ